MSLLIKLRQRLKNNRFLYTLFSPIAKLNHFLFHFYFKNRRFKRQGERVLLRAKNALDGTGIHYWLDFGTLLGVYRDKALLPNDLDIDIGLYLKDYSQSIEIAMQKQGFRLIHEYGIDNKAYGLEQSYELDGVKVDLFFYSVDDEKMWSHLFVNFPDMTHNESILKKGGLLPIEQYLPRIELTKIDFLDHEFSIPGQTHDYLAFHYGKDYRTPRKWNYMDLENDNRNAQYLFDKIGVYKSY